MISAIKALATVAAIEPSRAEIKCQFTMPDDAGYVNGSLKVSQVDGDAIVIPVPVQVE